MTTSILTSNKQVHLPNHALIDVTHISTIRILDDLVFHNVFYVSSFRLNLIYVSKLTKTRFSFVLFTDNMCRLQDQRSGKMMGTGTEQERLYYLDTTKKVGCHLVSASVSSSPWLWHQCLDSPSNKSMHALSLFIKNMNFCDIYSCMICPLATQTRIPFSLSSINTNVPFEFIHVDI